MHFTQSHKLKGKERKKNMNYTIINLSFYYSYTQMQMTEFIVLGIYNFARVHELCNCLPAVRWLVVNFFPKKIFLAQYLLSK